MYNHIFLDPCPRKSTEKLAVKVYPWSPQSLKNTWHGTGVCLKIRYPNIHWLILINHHYISLFEWHFFIAQFQTHPNILWLLYTTQLYPKCLQIPMTYPMNFPVSRCFKHHFQARPGARVLVVWVVPLLQGSTPSPFQASGSVQFFQMNFEAICGFKIGVPSGNLLHSYGKIHHF